MTTATRLYLVLSSLVLLVLGTTLSLAPQTMYLSYETKISGMLLSDLRSEGTNFLFLAVFSLFAVWKRRFLTTALILSALVYLGYGAGRFLGLALDGFSDTTFAIVTGLEWALGLAATGLLAQTLRNPHVSGLATA